MHAKRDDVDSFQIILCWHPAEFEHAMACVDKTMREPQRSKYNMRFGRSSSAGCMFRS